MSRVPNPTSSSRLLFVCVAGIAALAIVAALAFLLLRVRDQGAGIPDPIDWSREPNPFADGQDRDAFRALMREIDHDFLKIQNAVDTLEPSTGEPQFQELLAHARALSEAAGRPQFQYPEAPSAGLFEERREALRAGAQQLYAAIVARDVENVQGARAGIAKACDQCHGAVRLQSDIKPIMRYLEGLVARSQELLTDLAVRESAPLFTRFQELAVEFEGIAAAPVLRNYRREEAYERHVAQLEGAASALARAAETRSRRAVEVATLRLALGACESCHRQFVK
ncbi:MAG: hypothetical protein H6834_17460 [Planctomycetes bacterium]|nr:hypothetical protein [Planctomycetota bacterium]